MSFIYSFNKYMLSFSVLDIYLGSRNRDIRWDSVVIEITLDWGERTTKQVEYINIEIALRWIKKRQALRSMWAQEVLCFGHCGQMLVLGLTLEVGEEGACRWLGKNKGKGPNVMGICLLVQRRGWNRVIWGTAVGDGSGRQLEGESCSGGESPDWEAGSLCRVLSSGVTPGTHVRNATGEMTTEGKGGTYPRPYA